MTDEILELRDRYREMRAPGAMSTRVRASVTDQPQRGPFWKPATATVLALGLLAFVLPVLMDVEESVPTISEEPRRPSLSALAGMVPKKPAGRSTSLTRLRTLAKPKMPSKPGVKEPQANYPIHDDSFKEKKNALI